MEGRSNGSVVVCVLYFLYHFLDGLCKTSINLQIQIAHVTAMPHPVTERTSKHDTILFTYA